ncbi:MAG: hypothetical protein E6R13_09725 [Spirochaetes bacterium]|nr:MAG: hypothetical protein E6R13_09725 [Spirochaetota bacterium]
MYFVVNYNGKILSHYTEKPEHQFDSAVLVESNTITITEDVVNDVVKYTYTPDTFSLIEFKTGTVEYVQAQPLSVSEIEVHTGVFLDDTQENIDLIRLKHDIGTDATIIDKYYNVAVLTKSDLTNALSSLVTSVSDKIDAKNTTIATVLSAVSISDVASEVFIQEQTVNLIVDVDVYHFDDINQVTDEGLNQVVMPNDGMLLVSTISWLKDTIGIKSIGGQANTVDVIDSKTVTTSTLAFDNTSPLVTGSILADGLPVTLPMILYVKK